ncbi:MAG: NAD(+) synthase [Candidatus Woesearchaeota archaeon]
MLLPFADRDIPNLEQIMKKIPLPMIDPELTSRIIQRWIVEQIVGAGKKSGVVGLSGGVDSSTVACLAKDEFDIYNFGRPQSEQLTLYGAILPSSANALNDTTDGERVAEFLGIVPIKRSIDRIAQAYQDTIGDMIDNDFDRGNNYSEIRAGILSRIAAHYNGLIIGTGNRDEDYHLGYFTKRGDGAVDLSPLADLAKRHVRQIADYKKLAQDLVMRTSTAGLWAHQTDESELGFSYIEAEIVAEGKDKGFYAAQLIEICDFGYCRNEKKKDRLVVEEVLRMHALAPHKLKSPPVCNIQGKFYTSDVGVHT